MVVLNEHRCRGTPKLVGNRISEPGIDGAILGPVVRSKNRTHVGNVTQRPQAFVRKPVVVVPFLLRGKPDTPERIGFLAGGHAHAIMFVDDGSISIAGSVGDPGAAAFTHQGVERHSHAARYLGAAVMEPSTPRV